MPKLDELIRTNSVTSSELLISRTKRYSFTLFPREKQRSEKLSDFPAYLVSETRVISVLHDSHELNGIVALSFDVRQDVHAEVFVRCNLANDTNINIALFGIRMIVSCLIPLIQIKKWSLDDDGNFELHCSNDSKCRELLNLTLYSGEAIPTWAS